MDLQEHKWTRVPNILLIIKETTNIRGITPEMNSPSATITDAEY